MVAPTAIPVPLSLRQDNQVTETLSQNSNCQWGWGRSSLVRRLSVCHMQDHVFYPHHKTNESNTENLHNKEKATQRAFNTKRRVLMWVIAMTNCSLVLVTYLFDLSFGSRIKPRASHMLSSTTVLYPQTQQATIMYIRVPWWYWE